MSTSDKRKMGRAVRMYAVLTIFCTVFGSAHRQFSHGAFSSFMEYLFLFPLFGGAVSFLSLHLLPFSGLSGIALHYAYHSGLAALTVGSCLTDVFNIYGTTAPLVGMYWQIGTAFITASVLLHLLPQRVR